jgi:hypothetical protein
VDALDELAAFGPAFAVGTHAPQAQPTPPWRPLLELAEPADALRRRIETVRTALARLSGRPAGEIAPRIAASITQNELATRLIAPSIAAAATGRPLSMRLGELWWQDTLDDQLPLSVPHPGARTGDPPRLAALIEETIAPLTIATSDLVAVSPLVLWGNVAALANKAATRVAERRPELSRPAWAAAAALLASPRLSHERNPPGSEFRRSSCCLVYLIAPGRPRGVCRDCVLRRP